MAFEHSCNCVPINFVGKSASLGATEADIKENIRTIEIHRSFVYALGKTVYPEYDFIAHDLSKFSSAEVVPYTMKFILKSPDSENPGWNEALQHHYKQNPHHPQYWGKQSMPEEYLKESIIDMVAAKYQYQSSKEELPQFITADMFDFQPQYLVRYTETDREIVEQELHRLTNVNIDWTKKPVPKLPFCRLVNNL